ncbi:MAG TPA: phosphoribosyltransferase family protein [Acidimicrobiales bacterium]|nr:phosphoribosyltransferase family protein [Acidimicrobiales bacterium]
MFADRCDAGRRLAARLVNLRGRANVVLGLPRGGVVVALQVARELGCPLDVLVVRKLGVPSHPELAMGAVGENGVLVLERDVLGQTGLSRASLDSVVAGERAELERRVRTYRAARPKADLRDQIAVVVDDGIATGSTARAACQVAHVAGAAKVILAVPVAPRGWEARVGGAADELVCLETPASFWAIGECYDDFTQVGDDEVLACLAGAGAGAGADAGARAGPGAGAAPSASPRGKTGAT